MENINPQIINDLKNKDSNLEGRIFSVESRMNTHRHTKNDGTQSIDGDLELKSTSLISIGDKAGMGYFTINEDLASQQDSYLIGLGTVPGDATQSYAIKGVQYQYTDSPNDGSFNSFFYAYRAPMVTGSAGTVTTGGTTLTDSIRSFDTNILAGCTIHVQDISTGGTEAYTIASNTATTITITGGTWTADGAVIYQVYRPVFLGSANIPWRRLYTNEIRFGAGASAGTQVRWIKFGAGSPEGSITASPGSLYMRTDGGAGTSLYVKESGNSNTGWVGVGGSTFIGAKVYMNNTTAVNGSGYVKLPMATEGYDYGASYNTGTYTYTIPSDGFYEISVNARIVSGTANDVMAIQSLVNGIPGVDGGAYYLNRTGPYGIINASGWCTFTYSTTGNMIAGDTISHYIHSDSSTNKSLEENSYFTIKKIN